jgi:hypothetical protein
LLGIFALTMNIRAGTFLFFVVAAQMLAGCAWWPWKARETPSAPSGTPQNAAAPSVDTKKSVQPVIYVRPFAFHTARLISERRGKELQELKRDVSKALRERMQDRLEELGRVEKPPIGLPVSGWLVDGELLEVVDREMLRYAMGFDRTGVGLAARVRLYDLSVSSTVPMATWDIPSASERLSPDHAARVISICEMARILRERVGAELKPVP